MRVRRDGGDGHVQIAQIGSCLTQGSIEKLEPCRTESPAGLERKCDPRRSLQIAQIGSRIKECSGSRALRVRRDGGDGHVQIAQIGSCLTRGSIEKLEPCRTESPAGLERKCDPRRSLQIAQIGSRIKECSGSRALRVRRDGGDGHVQIAQIGSCLTRGSIEKLEPCRTESPAGLARKCDRRRSLQIAQIGSRIRGCSGSIASRVRRDGGDGHVQIAQIGSCLARGSMEKLEPCRTESPAGLARKCDPRRRLQIAQIGSRIRGCSGSIALRVRRDGGDGHVQIAQIGSCLTRGSIEKLEPCRTESPADLARKCDPRRRLQIAQIGSRIKGRSGSIGLRVRRDGGDGHVQIAQIGSRLTRGSIEKLEPCRTESPAGLARKCDPRRRLQIAQIGSRIRGCSGSIASRVRRDGGDGHVQIAQIGSCPARGSREKLEPCRTESPAGLARKSKNRLRIWRANESAATLSGSPRVAFVRVAACLGSSSAR